MYRRCLDPWSRGRLSASGGTSPRSDRPEVGPRPFLSVLLQTEPLPVPLRRFAGQGCLDSRSPAVGRACALPDVRHPHGTVTGSAPETSGTRASRLQKKDKSAGAPFFRRHLG